MNTKLKWSIGIGIAVMVVLILLVIGTVWAATGEYPMMGYRYGWHMPMMYQSFGMMGYGMIFYWLFQLALFVLLALTIAWLARGISSSKS